MNATDTPAERPALGLWDAVSFIVGVVVGAGIFETPWLVFSNVPGAEVGLLVWAIAGLLALVGALCYAELTSTYPRHGGEYYYLTRAYGRPVGFLFGWAQLAVIFPGSLGMMAFVFADYAVRLGGLPPAAGVWLALGAVAALTLVNCLGIVFGKWTQNALTVAKLLGLAAILVAGFCYPAPPADPPPPSDKPADISFAVALVLAYLAYSGWNDAAYLGADVRGRRRGLALALVLGAVIVTVLYLAVNGAYLSGLGFQGLQKPQPVAADLLAAAWGDAGLQAICVVVMVSALGALNGLILAGSRLYSAVGADHRLFAALGRWHPERRVPLVALLAQAGVATGLILLAGTPLGQQAYGGALQSLGLEAPKWDEVGKSGFEQMVKFTTPVFWSFFLLLAVSLLVLRQRDPGIERPFAVPLYPVLPVVFVGFCGYMLYSGVNYAGKLGWLGVALVAAGVPLYVLSARWGGVPLFPRLGTRSRP